MKIKKMAVLISLTISPVLYAQSPTTTWGSDVVENYLTPNKGSTISRFTDLDNNSRWYSTTRLKSGYVLTQGSEGPGVDNHRFYVQGNLRLRGKTMLTDDIGFFGDFWLQAQENYARTDGETVNDWDGLDEAIKWEQFRFGFEHSQFGALMYGKHSATWSPYVLDFGTQGIYDTQGESGGKNADKIIYKNHFDNNLFLNASYDLESKIHGFDIGYQTSDIYSFLPDSYGIYFAMHNGQPLIQNGTSIVGNVNPNGKYKSDRAATPFRDRDDLYTYALSGFKQFDRAHRVAAHVSYSKMHDSDTVEKILENNGQALGGVGVSATVVWQMLPTNGRGWNPYFSASYDEFGESFTPEVRYWLGPGSRVWIAHTFNTEAQDFTRIEYQLDF
ncbi:hypothetical protein NM22_00530 [Vibrio tubiashii]|nr:hypothetical protein NM22_00530 [Vibrio tubiashii]